MKDNEETRNCANCGDKFCSSHKSKLYCSRHCSKRKSVKLFVNQMRNNIRVPKPKGVTKVKTCVVCRVMFDAYGVEKACSPACKLVLYQERKKRKRKTVAGREAERRSREKQAQRRKNDLAFAEKQNAKSRRTYQRLKSMNPDKLKERQSKKNEYLRAHRKAQAIALRTLTELGINVW